MEKVFYLTSENDIKRIVQNVVDELRSSNPVEKPEPEATERLYTTKEALDFLRCSKPTLHRWKKEGIIPHVRIGTNIRYKESDLMKLIESKGV